MLGVGMSTVPTGNHGVNPGLHEPREHANNNSDNRGKNVHAHARILSIAHAAICTARHRFGLRRPSIGDGDALIAVEPTML
jgi:hypothetical protein